MHELTEAAKFSRLPRWAQEQIQMLRRDLKEVRHQLSAMQGAEKTNISYLRRTGEAQREERIYLPEHTNVRFQFGEAWYDYIEASIGEDQLTPVLRIVTGGMGLLVKGSAANTVNCRIEPRETDGRNK